MSPLRSLSSRRRLTLLTALILKPARQSGMGLRQSHTAVAKTDASDDEGEVNCAAVMPTMSWVTF